MDRSGVARLEGGEGPAGRGGRPVGTNAADGPASSRLVAINRIARNITKKPRALSAAPSFWSVRLARGWPSIVKEARAKIPAAVARSGAT
jgi:hypothetical protein